MKPIEKIKGHETKPINSVAFSADSQILTSGASDNTLRFWNREGKSLKVIEISEYDPCISWSPVGVTLASAGGKMIHLWDSNGNSIKDIDGKTRVIDHLAWSPDAKMLASSSQENTVNLWNTDGTHITELKGHTAGIAGIAWSPDNTMLVTVSSDAKIHLWDANGNLIKVAKEHYESETSIAWAPDSQTFAVGTWLKKHVRLYDREGKSDKILEGHKDKIADVAWANNGELLVSASTDKTAIIWDPSGTILETLKLKGAATAVAISPDSKLMAISSWDDKIPLYDLTEVEK